VADVLAFYQVFAKNRSNFMFIGVEKVLETLQKFGKLGAGKGALGYNPNPRRMKTM
jgi:hypothetical protein